jgi:hypothetical protein
MTLRTMIRRLTHSRLYHTLPDIQIDLQSEPLARLPNFWCRFPARFGLFIETLGQSCFLHAKLPSLIASQVKFGHLATNWPYLGNGRSYRHADCTSGRSIKIHFGPISRLVGLIVLRYRHVLYDTQSHSRLKPR